MVTEVRDVAVKIYWEKTSGIKRNTVTLLVTSKEVGWEINS